MDELTAGAIAAPEPPMELMLVLTHACNLACDYCYAGPKDGRAMPEAVARRGIAWVFDHCGGRLLLGWFGGEPLLRWDLLTALHGHAAGEARSRRIPLSGTLTTNATLLTADRMAWLADHGITVAVSIDGDAETHDRLRPLASGGSSFSAVRAGLRVALDRQPMTHTVSVVHPGNVPNLDRTVGFLLEEGVRQISLSPDPSADWDSRGLEIYREQLELVGERWLGEFRAGREVWIEPLDGKIISRVKGGLENCDRCAAGTRRLALAPSGNWYPCERMVGADGDRERFWALGNTLETMDGGPDPMTVAVLRAQQKDVPAECRRCPLGNRCHYGCSCSNVLATGTIATPGGAMCAAEQAAIAVADRVAVALWQEGNPLFLRRRYFLEVGRCTRRKGSF
ncbi:MAG: aldolase-type tim barrel [Deltaproteobacteria bacterium]|nr:aldolase-type tim barrel [Deltaproteobacteria bacterium]